MVSLEGGVHQVAEDREKLIRIGLCLHNIRESGVPAYMDVLHDVGKIVCTEAALQFRIRVEGLVRIEDHKAEPSVRKGPLGIVVPGPVPGFHVVVGPVQIVGQDIKGILQEVVIHIRCLFQHVPVLLLRHIRGKDVGDVQLSEYAALLAFFLCNMIRIREIKTVGQQGVAEGGLQFRQHIKRTVQEDDSFSRFCGCADIALLRELSYESLAEGARHLAPGAQAQMGIASNMSKLGLFRIRKNIQIEVVVLFPIGFPGREIEGFLVKAAGHTARYGKAGVFILQHPAVFVENSHMTGADPLVALFHIVPVVFVEIVLHQVFAAHEDPFFVIVEALGICIDADNKSILIGEQAVPHTVGPVLDIRGVFSPADPCPDRKDGRFRGRIVRIVIRASGGCLRIDPGRSAHIEIVVIRVVSALLCAVSGRRVRIGAAGILKSPALAFMGIFPRPQQDRIFVLF